MTSTDDLTAARNYLVEHGWCQNASRAGDRVCGFGAIFAVTGGQLSSSVPGANERRERACAVLQGTLDAFLGFPTPQVLFAEWQDMEGRTVDDVLDIYDMSGAGR